ncbi:MAG: arginyl-tRNA synthetase ArgS [Candidatus Berkelbacteria bacterium Licking1014_96]|uniref:Arginine--tRNA ligase n=1 Tax=Candidatus Berkelbacteria bacterium Licking1014_96 TaxID=2017149 RepID=A0A554LHC4_9BACT|nr:MAG: arginyl-tRNA synthetase ArgS [Candidatus Berkelbacteria bacterium Licking1014_96]
MIKKELEKLVREAGKKAGLKLPCVLISASEYGDYSTQIALSIKNNKKPGENAVVIIKNLPQNKIIERAEEKNGFINFYLSNQFLGESVKEIIEEGESFGENQNYKNKKIQVEFVSANPTGPLHLGNARGGPLGDVIGRILESSGAKVEREFYVNDIGSQIKHFGETILYWQGSARSDKVDFPEKGYPGEYMKEIAAKVKPSDKVELLAKDGIKLMVKEMKSSLAKIGIEYDQFIYESEILKSGKTEQVIKTLSDKGQSLVKKGAVWFGDSVLVRSDKNKTLTYFANDIAYHQDKFERGFELVIDIWGANHHGHIKRLKEAVGAVGIEPERLKIILYQFVRLKHGDKIEKMAKREGTYVTAEQVLNAVGKNAFRMTMLLQSPNTHLDFDLELAKKESKENPVYYLQYACARIAGILRKQSAGSSQQAAVSLNNYESALIKELIKFPDLISEISQSYEVHHLPHYGISLAKKFHQFYKNCPVIKAENEEIKKSRLTLIKATQTVLKNTLKILGISAPNKM